MAGVERLVVALASSFDRPAVRTVEGRGDRVGLLRNPSGNVLKRERRAKYWAGRERQVS